MTLLVILNGLRLLQFTLGAAMLMWWLPSLFYLMRGSPRRGDESRAAWLPFAFSSILFGVHNANLNLGETDNSRLYLAAHLCMVLTMFFAIYIRGRDVRGFQLRKVMAVHVALLFGCIAVAAYAA